MKLKKKLLAAVTALVLVVSTLSVAVFAANDDESYRPSISGGSRSIRVGRETSLSVRVTSSDSSLGSYTGGYYWTSDNTRVATVDSSGNVYGEGVGSATIRVEIDNGRSSSVTIHVTRSGSDYYYDDDYWNGYRWNDYDYGYYYGYGYGYFDDYGYWRYRTNPYNPDSYIYNSSRSSSTRSSSSTRTSSASDRTVVKLTETAPRETVLNRVREADGGHVILPNYAAVSAETLQAAAAISNSKIHFDTIYGKITVGRMSFTAANASKYSGTIDVGVYVDTGNTTTVANRFSKSFTNRTKIVLIDQRTFGAPVEISFQAGDLSASNLYFYTYDASNNNYNALTVSDVYKDENNYIHFNTSVGGYIVVSDGALSLV